MQLTTGFNIQIHTRLAVQIEIRSFGNFDIREFPLLQVEFSGIYQHLVIDIGRVKFGATDKVIAFFPVDDTTESLSYFLLIEFPRNLGLDFHNLIGTLLLDLFGYVIL